MNASAAVSAGLPTDLPAETLTLLFDHGRRLAIGVGECLEIHDVSTGRQVDRFNVDASLRGLEETSLGLVVALQHAEGWTLTLATDRCRPLVQGRGVVRGTAASGGSVLVLATNADWLGARLYSVDLHRRSVDRVVEVGTDATSVAVNQVTGNVVVSAGLSGGMLLLDPDLQRPARPMSALTKPAACNCSERPGCTCIRCCNPCGHGDEAPAAGDDKPHREPERPAPNEREPARPPGQVGIPTDDGGVITGDGGRIEHHRPPGSGRGPCGLNLFWRIAALQRYGNHVLALAHGGRQAALLSMEMDLIQEWNFGRQSAHFVRSAGAPLLMMFDRAARRWTLDSIADHVGFKAGLDRYPIFALQTKTFIGQQTYALSHDKNRPKLPLRTLVLPVIEGDQVYSSPNLSQFAAFMNRTMVPYAREYHVENSFGAMKASDFEFTIFASAGVPLRLPRGRLAAYYFPTYVGARVELLRSGTTAATPVVFDGRESLTIEASAATGSTVKGSVTLQGFALGFEREQNLFPASIKFLGTETLSLNVTTPGGLSRTLLLQFPARSFDMADDSAVAPKLTELETYLDGVFKAAELAAGEAGRLFAIPKARRVKRVGLGFGRLVVTVAAADLTGVRLQVVGATGSAPGGDPMGLLDSMRGTMTAASTARLRRYLTNALLVAQDAVPPFDYSNRLFEEPVCTFDPATGELRTTISISNRYGGVGASVTVSGSVAMDPLFASSAALPNTATSFGTSEALRDRGQLYTDALTLAIDRLEQDGRPITDLSGFGCVLVLPVEPGIVNAADPDAPRADELWGVTPLDRPFGFRGAENQATVEDSKKRIDPATGKPFQIQAGWSLIFMSGGKADNPLIVHELGHVLNFADLYREPPNYRDDLAYMGSWAMMDHHPDESHHCGYHKLQAHWIPYGAGTETDYGRVFPVGIPNPPPPTGGPGTPMTREVLLAPLEIWRESLVDSSRAAFGTGTGTPVVQLVSVDLGGDGATFVLIEARQAGARWGKKLPGGGGVLITNGITWNLDERFAHANQYRRPLHLLNPGNILRNPGDRFDLALAPELALKGTTVEVLDKKVVEGDATVYRIKISRENAEFVDLYFADGNPYYKSPDLWVDWAGNNGPSQSYSDKEADIPRPPLGTPTDQGEKIRVHPKEREHHWLVARLRNRGQVKALDVKLDFYFCDPPGAGDRGKNFKQMGTVSIAEVPGGDMPEFKALRWDVDPGSKGHTCLLVRIEDYRIPRDSAGAALGSDDVWQVNNSAQKNVSHYEALQVNPYEPIEFAFSVNNEGVSAELAYLEPEHLPFGMTLAVSPPRQVVPAGKTVIFDCRLELDSRVIAAGCRNDQRFRITAWREHAESAARWGGVEYEVRPRLKTVVEVSGTWDYSQLVEIKGKVTPNPGGGTARLRLDHGNHQPRWVRLDVAADGSFDLAEQAPSNSRVVEVVAVFDANRTHGSSRSGVCVIKAPPVIH